MMKLTIFAISLMACTQLSAADLTLKIKHRYLNFPISHRMDRKKMVMKVKNKEYCRFVIRLAEDNPDYWVFQDVSDLMGKSITFSYEGSDKALAQIRQEDAPHDAAEIYHEAERPQYHFTTKRGWINDPNGLVYADGKYHLYYQHNPYERDWENMHWGHAVSTDLLHWDEKPDALHPDSIGTIFSGSAVVDVANTSGFAKKKGQQPIVALYTADHPKYQRQCVAYSLDGGTTFTKYAGNPVIDSHAKWQSHDTRDPFVFWYQPKQRWVIVLNERDGHSIYNSTDLKHWEYKSHVTGFWECPGLFELPVEENPSERLWVMWGASGTYMVGHFDGETFTPVTPKQSNQNGSAYAAQVFNCLPTADSRVIKMVWGRLTFDGAPFNGFMLLPQRQTLHKTALGYQLYSYPVKETERLFTKVAEADNMSVDKANELMAPFKDNDMLHIRATLHFTYATDGGLSYRGQRLVNYDLNGNRLNGDFYAKATPTSTDLDIDVYIDRSVVEVYADNGAFSYSIKRNVNSKNPEGYRFWGNQIQVKHLEVSRAQSIW